jgi:preprotein translocase subunit SecF
MSRRERRLLRRQGKHAHETHQAYQAHQAAGAEAAGSEARVVEVKEGASTGLAEGHSHSGSKNKGANKIITSLLQLYDKSYKKTMWFTFILLILSIAIITANIISTPEHDFIPRGVSLKGGVTITVPYTEPLDVEILQSQLKTKFPGASITVRAMSTAGERTGFIVDASDVDPEQLLGAIKEYAGEFEKFNLETMGSALGEAFFKQTITAMLIAFVLMSIVVFLSFKTFVPSFAVILSAFSDIVMTIAVIDLFGIRIETAGIAALLMLIGYSVDTDILLTTRVLKRTEGTVFERVIDAMKTGMTMTLTAIAAVLVAFIFTQSETLKQIMLILLIGLIFDILNTWIQNVGILRIYLERKSKKEASMTISEFEGKKEER